MFFLILVRFLNTEKMFFFNFCFITLKTIALFEFIEQQLDNLFFYNCLCSKIICSNFAKHLISAIAKRKAQHHIDRNLLQ